MKGGNSMLETILGKKVIPIPLELKPVADDNFNEDSDVIFNTMEELNEFFIGDKLAKPIKGHGNQVSGELRYIPIYNGSNSRICVVFNRNLNGSLNFNFIGSKIAEGRVKGPAFLAVAHPSSSGILFDSIDEKDIAMIRKRLKDAITSENIG